MITIPEIKDVEGWEDISKQFNEVRLMKKPFFFFRIFNVDNKIGFKVLNDIGKKYTEIPELEVKNISIKALPSKKDVIEIWNQFYSTFSDSNEDGKVNLSEQVFAILDFQYYSCDKNVTRLKSSLLLFSVIPVDDNNCTLKFISANLVCGIKNTLDISKIIEVNSFKDLDFEQIKNTVGHGKVNF